MLSLQMIESTDLIPLSGEVAMITRRAEDFKDLHESRICKHIFRSLWMHLQVLTKR